MAIADSTLRHRPRNVYFIRGREKAAAANKLRGQCGSYIYSTAAAQTASEMAGYFEFSLRWVIK